MLYVFAGAFLLAAAVRGTRHAKTDRRDRRPHAAVQVAALVAAGCTTLTVALQLTLEPTAELKSIMNTGAIAGGFVTVVFGLWLNDRRTRLEETRQRGEQSSHDLERKRLHLEQQKSELERAKEWREHQEVADAGLVRAIELLGAEEPRVRSGALYALAAFAAHRSDRAQDVADLICMYLRNSSAEPDSTVRDAQRLLLRVVQQANRAGTEDLELDLSCARLDGLVLGHVTIRALNLSDAVLTGVTSMHALRLVEGTFGNEVHRVSMDRTVFEGEVWLHGARLRKLSAVGARFERGLSMTGAEVVHEVVLDDGQIAGVADFSNARFGALTCRATRFQASAVCRGLSVRSGANFLQARLSRADFRSVDWQAKTNFDEASFVDSLHLPPRPALPEVSLRRTRLGAAVATADFPEGWSIEERDGVRYLVAGQL